MLQLSMKCWNTAFNAPRSRLIIVVVKLGSVKIYVAAMETPWKRKEGMKLSLLGLTLFPDGFLSFIPCWMLMYFFAGFFLISPCVWPNSGFWCCVFLTLRITLMRYMQNCKYEVLINPKTLNFILIELENLDLILKGQQPSPRLSFQF